MTSQIERLKVLSAGILSLILMVGIARFAYTPLLPLMQQQAGLGVSEAGWLAAINYIGYLSGAIWASLISDLVLKDRLYRLGLVVAVVSTFVMGITDNFWLWSLSRFFAGLSSAAGLLAGSGLIMNWLIRHEHRSELGIHFAGIGLGIALCAFLVEIMSSHLVWSEQWIFLTLIGALILIPAWRWLPRPEKTTVTRTGKEMVDRPPGKTFLRLFMLAYFCAGVGYVVSATFIVAIVEQLPGLEGNGSWAFLILGLAAAPACMFWDMVARKVGNFNALIAAFTLQIVGILISVVEANLYVVLLGSALYGGTFIGIVSLVLSMAGRYYPTRPAKMMGKMTISYGVAQILAPAVTGLLAEYSGNYSDGLYMAAIIMAFGTLLMFRLKAIDQNEMKNSGTGSL
ncbi:MFS transporter [Solemya velum gill symbiont]|uniref:YbfB/YjiJ family MFS transporter n=1 Tax=Solemya velum gill symbiont TaxID=2340 RepID=UPI00099630C3|nr:YbfB/YjiJ family MFS transporter [Solemya velum gill symbiont]OOZ16494.1 MFS transporter [Solemya velum gill symbiont]OOZ26084.1 MFS transporter [Solemya velum gill symbiont]